MTANSAMVLRRTLRAATAILGLLFCLYCFWGAGRAGFSRLLSAYASNPTRNSALNYGQLDAADSAARLTPSDPEARLIRAVLLQADGRLEEAIAEYETATRLRPRDYVLWLELGVALDQAGDEAGAIASLSESSRLAPSYAQPRWQLGNLLLRAGRPDEAFVELRSAAGSNSAMLRQLISLAWAAYEGDVRQAEKAIQPRTNDSRLAWALFLAERGMGDEAVSIFRTLPEISGADRRSVLARLLASGQFGPAYEVWKAGESAPPQGAGFVNHGFENEIRLDEQGFGWQVGGGETALRISADRDRPREGALSLRIDWQGGGAPATPVVSQLVLVEPNARYQLRFAARTEQLATGGPPVLTVTAGVGGARPLAQSEALPRETDGWRVYTLDFATGNDERAVSVALRRQGCDGDPCPIFGRLWLDDFSLRRL